MNNPVSDNDWSMFPTRPEILEEAKNATSRGLMRFVESNIETFGRRVRLGMWFGTRARIALRPVKGVWKPHKTTFAERDKGYRYMIEIGGDPDDWDLDPEYTLEPFKRSFLGFRVARNK